MILLAAVVAVGCAGYMIIEGWDFFDSLYMTVITMTTIGFREVHDLSELGRVFTVMFVFISVGSVFYTLNNAAKILIEGELRDTFGRRRMRKMLKGMRDHYIVCGHGRMGRIIAKELLAEAAEFVVIEKTPAPSAEYGEPDYPIMQGDATKDEALKEAGIERARGLISVLPTDAENLYVVLSARGMNPGLNIVARAVEEGSEQKLIRAGANRVASPYHIGGQRIAHTVLKPAVVDFIEFTTKSGSLDLQMEELLLSEGAEIADKTIGESGIGREFGVIIVAIKKSDGTMKFNPTHMTKLHPGDTLVVIGEPDNLKALEKKAGSH